MRTPRAASTGFAVLALLALAACSPGPGGDGEEEPVGAPGAPEGIAACLPGTWQLDVADLAAQLQAHMVAQGTPVSSTEPAGAVTLDVDDAHMTYDSAVSLTMIAHLDSGLDMVFTQEQTGVSTGGWAAEGDTVVFSDWENGITVTNTFTIAGEVAEVPLELPTGTGSGVGMAVTCAGDSLTTQPDASPFVSTWARVG